jgi:pimeloyl-ACP methyl ester carboxylesterase
MERDFRRGQTAFGPFVMRWFERGAETNPRVLLLHGLYAGAHAYEWRRLAPLLAERFCVRVPDLLGAGMSDRPDLEFTRDVVQRSVDALIDDAGEDCLVVASSLTGAYALRSAARRTDGGKLLLITPSGRGALREHAPSTVNRAIYGLAQHTPLGNAFIDALTSEPSVRWFQTHKTYRDASVFDDDEARVTRETGRLPNAKHLQLAFVFGRIALDAATEDVERVQPHVLWACGQQFVDNAERNSWRDAGATVTETESGLPHVEEPEFVAQLVGAEMFR